MAPLTWHCERSPWNKRGRLDRLDEHGEDEVQDVPEAAAVALVPAPSGPAPRRRQGGPGARQNAGLI
eukprot:9512897-Alexandrium_andersonii.AAC.1